MLNDITYISNPFWDGYEQENRNLLKKKIGDTTVKVVRKQALR